MSGSASKATRRQIRRAVGVEGLEAVNTVAQHVYTGLVPAVEHHTATLNDHGRELDSHTRQLDRLTERLTRLESDARAVKEMTFLQRLRFAMQALT